MNGIGIWMEYNEIEPLWGSLWNEAWNEDTTKKFRELRRKLRAHIGHGLRTGIELYEIESPVVPQ